MRKQRATYEDVARGAADGDIVVVDFKGTIDGVPFEGGSATDFAFTVGQGRMLPEFEAAVVGMTAGSTKTFPLTFPADYTAASLAGKAAEFAVTVKKVQQPVLPPIDAEFAKSLGVADGDLDKMRAEVRSNLEREVGGRLKSRTRDSAMTALLSSTSFDVPKSVVEEEKQRLADMARRDLAQRGVQADSREAPLPLDLFAAQAERRVRLGLLVGEVVRTHGLQPRPGPDPQAGRGNGAELREAAGRDQLVSVGPQAAGRTGRHRARGKCDTLGAGDTRRSSMRRLPSTN